MALAHTTYRPGDMIRIDPWCRDMSVRAAPRRVLQPTFVNVENDVLFVVACIVTSLERWAYVVVGDSCGWVNEQTLVDWASLHVSAPLHMSHVHQA